MQDLFGEAHMEGWLHKQGENKRPGKGYKKRWFSLHSQQLFYYPTPQHQASGKQALGTIDIGDIIDIVSGTESQILPRKLQGMVPFDIITRGRIYHIIAETKEDAQYWMSGLKKYVKRIQDMEEEVSSWQGEMRSVCVPIIEQMTSHLGLPPSPLSSVTDADEEDDDSGTSEASASAGPANIIIQQLKSELRAKDQQIAELHTNLQTYLAVLKSKESLLERSIRKQEQIEQQVLQERGRSALLEEQLRRLRFVAPSTPSPAEPASASTAASLQSTPPAPESTVQHRGFLDRHKTNTVSYTGSHHATSTATESPLKLAHENAAVQTDPLLLTEVVATYRTTILTELEQEMALRRSPQQPTISETTSATEHKRGPRLRRSDSRNSAKLKYDDKLWLWLWLSAFVLLTATTVTS